ncbi:MAG TPA: flagellar hook-associated protein FlgK [Steroidobacteraceae bacterium]|nr:flagellar hook-associated protein FlgK [Steroidobacteraceae bacterium]
MSDMLSTAVSGLLAFQTALDTTSNNIANVDTPGYNEEVANFATSPATPAANGWIGNGVSVVGVTNQYNQFLADQTNSATSSYNQFNTLSSFASDIDNMFSDSTTGLSATLQSFSDAVQTLANSPSDDSARQAVLTQAQSLIGQFQSYQSYLAQLGSQVNSQIQATASSITSLGQSIASLNQQIVAAENNGTGQQPNQLLDQQENLIAQLSADVSVNTVTQSDGAVNVFIGNGQPLVVGGTSATLTSAPDQFNSGQLQLALQTSTGSVNVTPSISGGSLGGLLQFQQQMLIPGENALGQAAVALTTLVNNQNEAGLDLNGQPGQALLAVGGPAVLPSVDNTGNAQVSATISDLGSLTTSNYTLQYDGSAWSLVDSANGASTALSSSTSGGTTTLTGAGMTFTVTGTAGAGDEYLIEPTANAVEGMSLTTNDPAAIAAAAPLVTSAASANTGTAGIQSASVSDLATWTPDDYTLSFSSPTAYTVTNSAGATVVSGSYAAGTPISFDGVAVTLTGSPAAGDSFSIDYNANDSGDNRNALLLANVMNVNVLDGGTQSLAGAVQSYVGTVGLQTSQAQNGTTAQQSAMNSAQTAQQSVSGVNLDQEAANMLQYEQAYQAAAQLIATSQTLFASLLGAVGATATTGG